MIGLVKKNPKTKFEVNQTLFLDCEKSIKQAYQDFAGAFSATTFPL